MLLMRRKNDITISDTQHRTPPIPTLISIKEKERRCDKKRRPTPGAKKIKKGKTGGKLKESKLVN